MFGSGIEPAESGQGRGRVPETGDHSFGSPVGTGCHLLGSTGIGKTRQPRASHYGTGQHRRRARVRGPPRPCKAGNGVRRGRSRAAATEVERRTAMNGDDVIVPNTFSFLDLAGFAVLEAAACAA